MTEASHDEVMDPIILDELQAEVSVMRSRGIADEEIRQALVDTEFSEVEIRAVMGRGGAGAGS